MPRNIRSGIWLGAVLCIACSAPDSRPDFAARDSAGVRIVENAAPSGESFVRVPPDPSIIIGSEESLPLHDVTDVAFLGGGRIAVANAGSGEILIFDSTGSLERRIGGSGEGPGEFARLRDLHRLFGDSILAFDEGLARFSVFDSAGAYQRGFALADVRGMPGVTELLDDGSLLVAWARPFDDVGEPGVHRVRGVLVRHDLRGQVIGSIGVVPLGELALREDDGRRAAVIRPFAHETSIAGSAGGVLIATGDAFEFAEAGFDGRPRRIVRAAYQSRPVTPDDVDSFIERLLASGRTAQGRIDATFARMLSFPDSFPAIDAVLSDPCGATWVRAYAPPSADHAEWRVFDADGRWLESLRLPPRLDIRIIGTDRVIAVHRDDFDVETVRVHALTRLGACGARPREGSD